MEFGGAIDLEVEILFIGHVYNCYVALQSFTLSSPGPTYALGTTSLPQRILRLEKIFKYIICLKFHLHINTAIRFHYKNKKNEIQLEIYVSQGKGKFSLTINK